MNLFALSGLMIGITSSFLGLFVYFKNPRNIINRIWAFFSVAVSIWGFGIYKIATATDVSAALTWWRLAHIGVIFLPVLYFHFVYHFLRLKSKSVLVVIYLIGIIFLALDFTDLFIWHMRWVFSQFYYDSPPGPLYSFFVVFGFIKPVLEIKTILPIS